MRNPLPSQEEEAPRGLFPDQPGTILPSLMTPSRVTGNVVHTPTKGDRGWAHRAAATQARSKRSSQNFLPLDPAGGSREQPLNQSTRQGEDSRPSETILSSGDCLPGGWDLSGQPQEALAL